MNSIKCGPKTGVFLLSMGHCLIDFYNNFLPVLLPFLMVKLGMSLTLCGLLVMCLSITANLIQPILGFQFDRHDSSWALPLAAIFGGLFICFVGYVPNEPILFITCALLGVTVAAVHPLGTSLLSKVAPAKNMGRSLACYIVGGNLGFAIAPIAVMAMIEYGGLECLPVLAIPGILLGLAYYYTHIYRLPSANAKKKTEADEISANKEEFPSSGVREILKNSSVLKLNAAMGLRCWTHVAVGTFLPVLMINNGYSKMMAGSLLTLFLLGSAVGGLLGGELGDRFSHKKLMIFSLGLASIPIFYFFQYPTNGLISLIALFLGGAFVMAPQPSSIVWAGKLMPKYIGVASGMMMGFVYGAGSLGAAITAALADYIGLTPALLISIIPVILSCVLTITIKFPKNT